MTTAITAVRSTHVTAPAQERTVDETLCAAVYVCEGLPEYVLGRFHHGPPVAWAPSPTVDALALLRHATVARRVRRLRDVFLCLLAITAVVVPAATAGQVLGGPAALVMASAMIILWYRWLYLQRSRDRVTDPGQESRKPRLRRVRRLALALAFVVPTLLIAGREPRLAFCVATIVLIVAFGWAAAVAELMWAQRRAQAILTRAAPPRDLAPPLDAAVEERVGRLATTNVVPYQALRASAPFVGNGFRVRPWHIDVDVHRGAIGVDGKEKVPDDVDIPRLHEFLHTHFSLETSVETTDARRWNTGHRLYLDGTRIPWGSDLLTGEPPLPRERVEWDDLVERIRHPENAIYQRAYFYLEEISRNGEIAVALFVRPQLHGAHLSIELVPHVILPIDQDVEMTVADLPEHPLDRWTVALRSCTPATLRLVLGGPAECARDVWAVIRRHYARRLWRRASRRRRRYDFGAVMSLREGVSMVDPQGLSHFVTSDLARINTHLQGRIVGSIKQYLDGLGIDTQSLDDSMKKTVNNIQNWNVGDVRADMVGFGNDNTFGRRPHDDDYDRREKK
jgi:hypothetical protein